MVLVQELNTYTRAIITAALNGELDNVVRNFTGIWIAISCFMSQCACRNFKSLKLHGLIKLRLTINQLIWLPSL